MNRWKINKYGFVNFWLFDKEEIRTYEGNLLLTGENGSGKSVTLQSFIPLIFDGNTSSRRLSTEGDNSRQMEYYLLYGDKKEAISYIYAEFIKKDDNGKKKYLTLIIGMKLRQGQGTPKKWFVILKNQRVGSDINLFKHDKDFIEPFDKMELKKKLEAINLDFEFYDNTNEYKLGVNKNLFEFKSIDEFEETIDLIVELRQPNLRDNTGFDPKYIYDILNKSLKIISDKDLKSISDTFEKIEEISEELKNQEKQFEVLSKIDEKYKRYKKIVLAQILEDYKEKLEIYEKNQNEINNNKKGIDKLGASIKKEEEKIDKYNLELKGKIQERYSIQDKSQSVIERKRIKTTELKDVLADITNLEESIGKTESNIKKYIKQKEDNLGEYSQCEHEYLELEVQIRKAEIQLAFNSNINYLNILEDKRENPFTTSDFYFERHKKNLERLFELLNKNNFYHNKIKNINKDLDKEENELYLLDEKKKNLTDVNSRKIKEFFDFLKNRRNKLINFNYGEIQEFISILEEFDDTDFAEKMRKKISYVKEDINKEINQCKIAEERLIEEIKNINHQKKEIEAEKDIKIELLTHKEIERKNYSHHKALYEVIKFKDNINSQLEGKIEKSLWEMGLLDALVSDENEIFDKFLQGHNIKTPNLTEFLEVEKDYEYRDKIISILSSISTVEQGDIYIKPDGSYKNLLIKGKVDKWQGRYIGVEARRKLRMEKIDKLNKIIENLEERLELVKVNLSEINNKLLMVQEEYRELTNIYRELFSEINKEYDTCINESNFIKKRIEKHKVDLVTNENERTKLIKILENESKKLGLEISNFDSVKENLKTFEILYEKIKDKYKLILTIYKSIKSSESMERENEEKLEEQKRKRRILLKNKEDLTILLTNLEREIEEKGHSLALRRLEKLNEEIHKIIPLKIQDAKEKLGGQKTKIETLRKNLEEALNKQENIKQIYYISDSILKEELNKTDHDINTSLYSDSKGKLNLYEQHREFLNMSYSKDFNYISQSLSKNELLLKPFGLTLEEYNYLDTREKYQDFNRKERFILKAITKGRTSQFENLITLLREQISRRKEYLNEEEQKFFKEMLFSYINKEIADRIKESKSWVKRIDDIMKRAKTNSGKRYSIKWVPKNIGFGLSGDDLFQSILNLNNPSNKGLDSESLIREYFNKKTKELKSNAQNESTLRSSYEILKEILDYRKWFEFSMSVIEDSSSKKKSLNKRRLNSFSGGEKAMAMYIPLFSALYARFGNASVESPMIITMDEAFSVVDDENIAKLFEILEDLNLNYLLASQKLSGTYDTVKALAIVYIENMTAKRNLAPSEGFITLIKYLWNGVERSRDLRGEEGGQRLLF